MVTKLPKNYTKMTWEEKEIIKREITADTVMAVQQALPLSINYCPVGHAGTLDAALAAARHALAVRVAHAEEF